MNRSGLRMPVELVQLQSDNILPRWKCIIIMLLRVLRKDKKKWKNRKGRVLRISSVEARGNVIKTSKSWNVLNEPDEQFVIHIWIFFWPCFPFFTDTCHWTDQKCVSSGWKQTWESLLGLKHFILSVKNLFFCRTKWYYKST